MSNENDRSVGNETFIQFNITGLSRRHVLFLQLVAEYDLSILTTQLRVMDALLHKNAPPLDRTSYGSRGVVETGEERVELGD